MGSRQIEVRVNRHDGPDEVARKFVEALAKAGVQVQEDAGNEGNEETLIYHITPVGLLPTD